MSIDCKFPVEFLDDALRGQVFSGLCNKAIQSHLLSETDLNFAQAVTITQGMAAAKRDVHKLKGIDPLTVSKITEEIFFTRSCFRCGKGSHSLSTRIFKDAKCHACGMWQVT